MEMNRNLALIIVGALAVTLVIFIYFADSSSNVGLWNLVFPKKIPPVPVNETPSEKSVKKFVSEAEFKEYLEKSRELLAGGFYGLGGMRASTMALESMPAIPALESGAPTGKGADTVQSAERVSETNVQVLGIDEPDIVKTNGKEIFFSREGYNIFYRGGPAPMMEKSLMPPFYQPEGETKIISAFPPENLAMKTKIEKGGELLLVGDMLVVSDGRALYGFDVSNTASPKESWKISLEENNYMVSSRLYKEKIYVVLSQYINEYQPCPIKPLTANGIALEIRCADIYHPIQPVPIDTAYTALIINPKDGKIEQSISLAGYSGDSLVYMSGDNLYLTYSYSADIFPILSGFFTQKTKDLFSEGLITKIANLMKYDISSQAKLTELFTLLESYNRGLSGDERLKLENEIQNRASDYFKERARELEFTGIVKVSLADFGIAATGKVPGRPLNQFSLDEYASHLRIATTISGGFWFGFGGGQSESANDVYVLDSDLNISGSVLGMGITERIYSVRFLGNRGYVVTFRQIDPFYVLDLSDPARPEVKGELKIPGYSSYLHPIEDNKILGVGQEGSSVKLSLFDVTFPENPKEISKYLLNEYWSEASNNHHAFLQDKKHSVFFLPGSQGGYVFSYANDELKLTKAVSGISSPRRAIYLNDYLYIIAENKIVVLNENNWERVKELDL